MNELTNAPQPSSNGVYANGTAEISTPEASVETPTPDNAGLLSVPTPATRASTLNLDALLAAASAQISIATTSEQELNGMLAEREGLVSRAESVQSIQTSRLTRINSFHPLEGVTPQSYQRLVELKLTTPADVARIEQAQATLAQIEALTEVSPELDAIRTQIGVARLEFDNEMDAQIAGEQFELTMRRGRAQLTAQTLYGTRLNELEAQISAIEANPRVQARLTANTTALEVARSAVAQEEAARIEREAEAETREYTRLLQSVTARQQNTVNRIEQALNIDAFASQLVDFSNRPFSPARQQYFDRLRNQLIEQILIGDGRTFRQTSDLVPFVQTAKGVDYMTAVSQLDQAPATIQELPQYRQAADLNQAFRTLIGRKYIPQSNGQKPKLSPLYQAFETRIRNDRTGETARLQKVTREAREADQAAFVTAGGFEIQVPIYGTQLIDGQRQRVVTGYRSGAVRLTREGDNYTVAEVRGYTGTLRVGQTSSLRMESFPDYLRNMFAMQGDNYVERIDYATDETE